MGIRVEAMKSHALAEPIGVETMGLSDSRKSPISRGFQEISDMFPRTYGLLTVYTDQTQRQLSEGECILTPVDNPVGMRTDTKAIYTEISVKRDTMNSIIKSGEVFELAELLPYQEGKIINMDIAHNEKMKFVIMSFDEGTGLTEHAAPGEAMVFALDGSAVIGYEGQEHRIKAGENFKFAAGGKHWVKADGRFKMALLMTLA